MPNWYENVLTARGDEKQIERLKSRAIGKDGDGKAVPFRFESLVPIPPEFDREKGGGVTEENSKKWAHWSWSNWGTRGSALDAEIILDGKEEVAYSFHTASAPCDNLVENVSREFPALEFSLKYFSVDAGIEGRVVIKNGNAESRWQGELGSEEAAEDER